MVSGEIPRPFSIQTKRAPGWGSFKVVCGEVLLHIADCLGAIVNELGPVVDEAAV